MERQKYPRTPHLPWSPGRTSDDKVLPDIENLLGNPFVFTEKRDGENMTIYSDGYIHARSTSGNQHPSQDWAKNWTPSWSHNLPEGWRVCGEYLYAIHSIEYPNLQSYFEVFSIWDQDNKCLSWAETKEWCELLDLHHVPELKVGQSLSKSDFQEIESSFDLSRAEGYVVRFSGSFPYDQFPKHMAKYVRRNHIQTDEHWRENWRQACLRGTSNV